MTKKSSPRWGLKKKMTRDKRCLDCGTAYAMAWALRNHRKLCLEVPA